MSLGEGGATEAEGEATEESKREGKDVLAVPLLDAMMRVRVRCQGRGGRQKDSDSDHTGRRPRPQLSALC